jgi:hypothetical protein
MQATTSLPIRETDPIKIMGEFLFNRAPARIPPAPFGLLDQTKVFPVKLPSLGRPYGVLKTRSRHLERISVWDSPHPREKAKNYHNTYKIYT